jgi:23S rRNA (uracil1939-C5)-methyltransferase
MEEIIQIVGISSRGEGYGFLNNKKVFVPFAIPDDKVKIKKISENNKFIRGSIVDILKLSKDRIESKCPYFYKCGGCLLWHLNKEAYYQYKLNLIKNSVSYAGFDISNIKELVKIEEGCRRRVNFKVSNNNELGFFEQNSNEIVGIDNCLIAKNEINKLINPLKKLIQKFSINNLKEIFISYVDEGSIDLILKLKRELNFREFELLKVFIDKNKISCLSYDLGNELILVYKRKNLQTIISQGKPDPSSSYQQGEDKNLPKNIILTIPAGTFLQATKEGQEAITKEVIRALKGNRKILDLYSGIGTYTFPLSYFATKIVAVEGDRNMVESIKNNINLNNLNNKIETFSRDLVNRPIMLDRLNEFDGIVINPPRSGSKAQCEFIAKSNVKTVVMVSCNPSAFSVDAKILREGGYNLERVVGIDQFYRSVHLEIVGVFKK